MYVKGRANKTFGKFPPLITSRAGAQRRGNPSGNLFLKVCLPPEVTTATHRGGGCRPKEGERGMHATRQRLEGDLIWLPPWRPESCESGAARSVRCSRHVAVVIGVAAVVFGEVGSVVFAQVRESGYR